jgi:cation-transporting ATPase E
VLTRPDGLTSAEVEQRVASGRTNATSMRSSRSVGEILRANVFTVFNGLLTVLFAAVLLTGRWQNALFYGVVVVNSAFGIVQELRAKRTLDRLAVLNAARGHVVRDGEERAVPVEGVVLDDLLVLRVGDQVPVDGVTRSSAGLSVDESLLTGESEPVAKEAEDRVLSGSIVVAGSGRMQATAVGDAAYAVGLATEARRYTRTHSELMAGINTILRWAAVGLVVIGPVLLWSQFRTRDNETWQDAVIGTVGALTGMIPEGLVLLTTLAFLIATQRLARQQTLVQELPAVEGLARVDVVCLDKTGTLTHGNLRLDRLVHLPEGSTGDAAVPAALGMLARADPANATSAALTQAFPAPDGTGDPLDLAPFSSMRQWSAVRTTDGVSWVLGAPEMMVPDPVPGEQATARAAADRLAAEGRRVLLVARSPRPWYRGDGEPLLPADLTPRALVVLAERLRKDAPQTLAYFTEQGVALKVISGDNPRTVGAVAAAAGVPKVSGAADAVDARTLPQDADALADDMEAQSVFGRVTPHQKRAMVTALQRRGHVVAMTGDGVNDALALKEADIGVAMASGSPATRAVAQLVLLDGRLAHLPAAVAEGRRVTANVERSANLFLIKNIYSLLLAVITVIALVAYPFEPIQATLVTAVTIGIPGFVLALGANTRRYRPGFLRRVLAFAISVGLIDGAAAYAGYAAARWLEPAAGVAGARTTTTFVLVVVGLWTVGVLARPLQAWHVALFAGLAGVVVVVLALPPLGAGILMLQVTRTSVLAAAVLGGAGALLVEVVHRFAPRVAGGGVSPPARRGG